MKNLSLLIAILTLCSCGVISSDYTCNSDSTFFNMQSINSSDTESLSIFKLTKTVNIGNDTLDYKQRGNEISFVDNWDFDYESGNRAYSFDLISQELTFVGYSTPKQGVAAGKNLFKSRTYKCKKV